MSKLILFIPTISIFFFSLFNNATLKAEKKEIDFNTIKSEIEWFIEKVKPESYRDGQHNVYAVKIYEGNSKGEYCVTMGYIDNSLLIRYIDGFKYYLFLEENLIILDYSDDFKEKYTFKNVDIIKPLISKQIIIGKLDMKIDIVGVSSGYVCCFEDGCIKKVYYEDSDEIPNEKAIFNVTPHSGKVIEVDSSTFKQMLRDTQKKSIK